LFINLSFITLSASNQKHESEKSSTQLEKKWNKSAKNEPKWKRGIERERTSLGVAHSQPREDSRRFQKKHFFRSLVRSSGLGPDGRFQ